MKIKVILFNSDKSKKEFELKKGSRPWNIIFIISKGSINLKLLNENKEYVIKENEIALISENTPFERKILSPVDFYQFAFQITEKTAICDGLTAGKMDIPTEQVKAIIASCNRLILSKNQNELSVEMVRRIISENNLFSKSADFSSYNLSDDVLKVIDYMHENVSKKIEIEKLAKSVYLSHSGLIYKFKKELNITPIDYLNKIRLNKAKQLLLENELTINEIADQCGFKNGYYFSNAFKKNTGIRPTDYRNKYIK